MQVQVSGSNMDVGQALTDYVQEHLIKDVKKYFEKAVNAEVHFAKEAGHLIKTVITVNEGVRGGINVKSDAQGGDAYGCFNEALQKAAKQLRRYKRRIKNYRRNGGGIKNIEPNYKLLGATKYVIPPLNYDVFAEMEENETEETLNIINEKATDVERLSVNEAVMKMDLANLPALIFINNENNRLNVVYHRKDGNISWIDPKN